MSGILHYQAVQIDIELSFIPYMRYHFGHCWRNTSPLTKPSIDLIYTDGQICVQTGSSNQK